MLKIGITGGIGSGKSIVCRIFKQLGTPVYDADSNAKQIMDTDTAIKKKLIAKFGEDIYNEQEVLIREKLAEIIFNNKKALNYVNSVVHPAVNKYFENWVSIHQQSKYVIKEAAILFESGSHQNLDAVIMVYAPKELRIKRVVERDKTDANSVRQRIKNQLDEEQKLKLADFVVYNDEQKLLIPQILALHKEFVNTSL